MSSERNGAWFVRTNKQRLQMELPIRPIPLDCSATEYHKRLSQIGERLEKENLVYIAEMYQDQLQEGAKESYSIQTSY